MRTPTTIVKKRRVTVRRKRGGATTVSHCADKNELCDFANSVSMNANGDSHIPIDCEKSAVVPFKVKRDIETLNKNKGKYDDVKKEVVTQLLGEYDAKYKGCFETSPSNEPVKPDETTASPDESPSEQITENAPEPSAENPIEKVIQQLNPDGISANPDDIMVKVPKTIPECATLLLSNINYLCSINQKNGEKFVKDKDAKLINMSNNNPYVHNKCIPDAQWPINNYMTVSRNIREITFFVKFYSTLNPDIICEIVYVAGMDLPNEIIKKSQERVELYAGDVRENKIYINRLVRVKISYEDAKQFLSDKTNPLILFLDINQPKPSGGKRKTRKQRGRK